MDRKVEATCQQCSRDDYVSVDSSVHDRYLMREGLVQDMFPKLTPADRDIIISANAPHNRTSGISYYLCSPCWKISIAADVESVVSVDTDN